MAPSTSCGISAWPAWPSLDFGTSKHNQQTKYLLEDEMTGWRRTEVAGEGSVQPSCEVLFCFFPPVNPDREQTRNQLGLKQRLVLFVCLVLLFQETAELTDGGAEWLQVDANFTLVRLHALGKDRTGRFLCAPAGGVINPSAAAGGTRQGGL